MSDNCPRYKQQTLMKAQLQRKQKTVLILLLFLLNPDPPAETGVPGCSSDLPWGGRCRNPCVVSARGDGSATGVFKVPTATISL